MATKKTASTEHAPAGSQAEYERFLPHAQKIAATTVRRLRADVSLAITNANHGVEAVLTGSAIIETALPKVSLHAIKDLPNLGLAVAYAAGQVDRHVPPPTDTKAQLARATELRALLLDSADSLATAGVFSKEAVKKIHVGHGGIDTAGDCVALAALFQKNAHAVRGKTPVTAAQIREAAEVGSRLLAVLRPANARKKIKGKELAALTDARDRLWTLFETTWEDHVWRAGAWLFKRQVDEYVRPLQSRVVGKRPAKKAPPTAAPPT